MYSRYFVLLCVFALTVSIYSQTEIEGYIYDSLSGEPIHDAEVTLLSTGAKTESDVSGFFQLVTFSQSTQKIRVKMQGYKEISLDVLPGSGDINVLLQPKEITISQIDVTARKEQGTLVFGEIDFKLRPVNTSQDLLRIVPGLFIAQHAGGGKAEQIFLRGFDSDHGTDLYISVDGMPVNMVSHAHGQGYADLHFVIPETVEDFKVIKGPYSLKFGDFSTSGAVEFYTKKKITGSSVKLEYGKFNSSRISGLFNILPKRSKAGNLYLAGEYAFTDGYFDVKQKFSRYNVFGKYYGYPWRRTALELSASSFSAHWNASGQVPERSIISGEINRFGSIDSSEGGNTARTNFNLILHTDLKNGIEIKNQAFFVKYDFNLYSNFTLYLNDSLNGDEINQIDKRNILGYRGLISFRKDAGGSVFKTTLGAGFRMDFSDISLAKSRQRSFISYLADGKLDQKSFYGYAEEFIELGDKLTLNGGVRFDLYSFKYDDRLIGQNGTKSKSIVSPKLNIYYDFNSSAQLYVKTGFGFHSNDARVVVTNPDENTLPRAFGYELGSQFKIGPNFVGNFALWGLNLESEFVYVGDEAVVEPSGRSRRLGAELSVRMQLNKWLWADADLNYTYGRLLDEPDGQNYIPLAPDLSSVGGITVKFANGFEGSLRYRYLKDRPANEDNTVIAKGHFVTDAGFTYSFGRFQTGLSFENLLNTEWNEAQFDTESRLRNEVLPVSELHFTPGTPFNVKGFIGISF